MGYKNQKILNRTSRNLLWIVIVVIIFTIFAGCSTSSQNFDNEVTTNTTIPVTTESPTKHSHEFTPANCTTPETCSCGETQGAVLGHTWAKANCIAPKTCSTCGEQKGKSNGHQWTDATCTTPKTCSDCGLTKGKSMGHNWSGMTCVKQKSCSRCLMKKGTPPGHNYANGKCTTCYAEDPNYVSEVMVWIPTNGGTKYHTHSGCSNMIGPQEVAKSRAISLGFTPCGRCY